SWQLFYRGVLRSDPSLPCCSSGVYCPQASHLGSAGGFCRGVAAFCRDLPCLFLAYLFFSVTRDYPGHRHHSRRCGTYTTSSDSTACYIRRSCVRRWGELAPIGWHIAVGPR